MSDQEDLYSKHDEQLAASVPSPERIEALHNAFETAFEAFIVERQVGYIRFDQVSAEELADIFVRYPIVIKSVLACINVASRAIARDLDIDFKTYPKRITPLKAATVAGYVKPMLPLELSIPALVELDRYFWTDKEMRASKGRWEKKILIALNRQSSAEFRKRMFKCEGEDFEIDAALPANGQPIQIAVDVKRIESPRDIHKRSDEIVNKATKFKATYPSGIFVAVVYYPFPTQHTNVQSRLQNEYVDSVFFASETDSSIGHASALILSKYDLLDMDETEGEGDQ